MKILIYREDLKILVVKKDSNYLLPQFSNEDLKQLRQDIKEQLGFWVNISGEKIDDLMIASRIFGPQIVASKWVKIDEIDEVSNKERIENLIKEDIKHWQDRQLKIIKEVFEEFNKVGINIYLYGGWGVDFLAGKVTRPHVDIDTFIDIKDKERARKVIEEMGYLIKDKVKKFQNERGEFSEGFDVYFLDFNYKEPDVHGNIFIPELFTGAVERTLNGTKAKVINPKLFSEMLERKIQFNKNNSEELSGPIDKTEHDLKLVREYLKI